MTSSHGDSKSFSCNLISNSLLEAFHGIEWETVWQHGMRLNWCRNEVHYITPILFMQQDLLICSCSEQLDRLEKEQVAVAQTIDHKIDGWNLECYTYKLNMTNAVVSLVA